MKLTIEVWRQAHRDAEGRFERHDIDGVEPMTSNVAQPMRLRDDVVTDGGKVEAVLSNSPRSADGFIVVPKVVE